MNDKSSASFEETAPKAEQSGPAVETSGFLSNFDLLFDAAPTPILVVDKETLLFRAVNDAALKFYGYSRDEFLQLRLPDIRPEKIQGEIEQ